MAIYLLDTSVIIDVLNKRQGRRELLLQLALQGNSLACCTINVIEVYSGMRPREKSFTDEFLAGLDYFEISWDVAELAGRLKYEWSRRGQSLSLPDATIAAVAIHHKLTLMTDNRKHFPMPQLQFYAL
ncbi:MAG: type II toxin-antitoxin system VapC family toxin [Bryobacteraceae bacterium]